MCQYFKQKALAILAVIFVIAPFDCYSQKLTEGSLAFLKGQENIHVVFDFSDAKLQNKPEGEYLASVTQQWAEGWEAAKSSTFMDRLLEHLNKNARTLQFGNYPNAEYQATVRVITVSRRMPGPSLPYLDGPGIRNVACEVVFTRTGDSMPLAKITKLNGKSQKGGVPTPTVAGTTQQTGVAFGYIGRDLGKFIEKGMKKLK